MSESLVGGDRTKPIVCIIIGMAGTGKTTFVKCLNDYVVKHTIPSYFINLDPAVNKLLFSPNIDIRDSLNYKAIMKQYNLGPNGAILTAMNLFSTKFDQVMNFVEKHANELEYVFIDTPGQIEVFNWSASGSIITESFANTFPTIFVYVADTPRCSNPSTFVNNMLYACSILYKNRLPLILLFNKTDIVNCDQCLEWMQSSEAFEEAVRDQENYMGCFVQSMELMLQEFYQNLNAIGISSVTGSGLDKFFQATSESVKIYETEYRQELVDKIKKREAKEARRQEKQLQKLISQLELDSKNTTNIQAKSPSNCVGQTVIEQSGKNMTDDSNSEG